ncbi:hypothetical protein [Mycoplasma sp. ATU-Cv-508]|uniref:hypothetical protein n=1 Tax=Mycoplasma sp. ATU-Cv-508 TaxID=2048001 RepID=UPI000FDD0DCC
MLGVARKVNSQPWQKRPIARAVKYASFKINGEVDSIVLNQLSGRILASLEHFVSKGAMDIPGLSTWFRVIF